MFVSAMLVHLQNVVVLVLLGITTLMTMTINMILKPLRFLGAIFTSLLLYTSCHAVDAKELNCLTLAIYKEARGESNLGQQLVGKVVLNRVEDPYFPDTICKVVYQKNQFSWTKDKKASGRLLKGDLRGLNQKDRAAYLEAKIIALSLIKEGIEVPKKYKDVLYFVHTKVHKQQKWLTGLRFIGKVGSHRFYGNKKG